MQQRTLPCPQQQMTADELARLAEAMGVPLPPERAAPLADAVADVFAFTRELDAVVAPDVMPATVFEAEAEPDDER
jgi:hypothetical protein